MIGRCPKDLLSHPLSLVCLRFQGEICEPNGELLMLELIADRPTFSLGGQTVSIGLRARQLLSSKETAPKIRVVERSWTGHFDPWLYSHKASYRCFP